jgi:uncharacterized protein
LEIQIIISSARYFSENGYSFLRFNPRGRWPSKGKFANMDVSDTGGDLENAILFARRRGFKRIGIIGHSLGGIAAILAKKKFVTAIALWEPSPLNALMKMASRKMKEEMKSRGFGFNEKYGYVMGKRMYSEFEKLNSNILETIHKIDVPVFIAAGTQSKPMTKAVRDYYGALTVPKELRIIKGANHTFDNWTHENELFESSLRWFKRWLL